MPADRAADAQRLRMRLEAHPDDAVGWHNLASAEGDLGNAVQAEAAARRALALGLRAPETRFVLARALQEQGRLDEADASFRECLGLRPDYAQAHRDLAQLRWMRTGDVALALRELDQAILGAPRQAGLHLVRSIVLEFAGDEPGALDSVAAGLSLVPGDLQLLCQAVHLHASLGQGQEALAVARRAVTLAPADATAGIAFCEAQLAAGRVAEAQATASALREANPLDQHAIALQATAWRLLGDSRAHALCDYGTLVAALPIQAPEGWASLTAYLAELKGVLEGLHRFQSHPFQQSVRGGGQLTLHGAETSKPPLSALFDRVHATAGGWLKALGRGPDPFRSRNSGGFSVTGAWSIRLSAGGLHTDHVHPRGWLSGVFYVDVPPEVSASGAQGRAGWLRLGRPGIRTQPELPAEFHVQPLPGRLVLFPAYMWHGVETFDSASPRITIAFDALPA